MITANEKYQAEYTVAKISIIKCDLTSPPSWIKKSRCREVLNQWQTWGAERSSLYKHRLPRTWICLVWGSSDGIWRKGITKFSYCYLAVLSRERPELLGWPSGACQRQHSHGVTGIRASTDHWHGLGQVRVYVHEPECRASAWATGSGRAPGRGPPRGHGELHARRPASGPRSTRNMSSRDWTAGSSDYRPCVMVDPARAPGRERSCRINHYAVAPPEPRIPASSRHSSRP